MPDIPVLPRIVVRGETAMSWDGAVPLTEAFEAMDRALQDFGRVLVWDLGGIERNRPNLRVVRHFEGDNVWVDAGVRLADSVIDVLVAGAERVVVGTKTLRDLAELDEARKLTENLVPLLDFVRGKVWGPESATAVSPRELMTGWRERGTDTVLLVDEEGEIPESVLRDIPEGLAAFAGLVAMKESGSLPAGIGAIVDIWEAVPRKT